MREILNDCYYNVWFALRQFKFEIRKFIGIIRFWFAFNFKKEARYDKNSETDKKE